MRQIENIRAVMLVLGISLLAIAFVILFARVDTSEPDMALVITAPFLVAIGIFPFTSPASLIFIEALATARIAFGSPNWSQNW